jgi:hypothetical protein
MDYKVDEKLDIAFPMVSFCDIPLSQTRDHVQTYGNYGIGLTKEWGQKHGISPVSYMYRESLMARSIRKIYDKYKILRDSVDIFNLFRFVKPYMGALWRVSGVIDNVLFYNEREWRYVPLDHKALLLKDDFLNEEFRNTCNKELALSYFIPFIPSDIRYLIVKNDAEILPLIREIERIKSRYSYEQVKILTSRIITSERIKEDF